jgi:gamma-glutamyl:cysteine ligase YbdK (ATP-grasp superfamily)
VSDAEGSSPAGAGENRLGLFEGYGVEIEYMIADRGSLDLRPICDRLMEAVAGAPESEIERGAISWSNELALHVLELKTNGPSPALSGLVQAFHTGVRDANRVLESMGARLLPGGMHPWMDPETETRLWPHEYTAVYRTFDQIFGCSGHGWSNLQSTHLNLPFRDDEEFGRLHAAIRLVLPLIPALAASSPFVDGLRGPALDTRLIMYRGNARRIPSVAGVVVPEAVFTRAQYEREILGRIYDDLAGHDPEGVLRHEWVNARGAIARFDRGAIEIRLIDTQECPAADLAVVAAVVEVVRALSVGPLADRVLADDPGHDRLAAVLTRSIQDGERGLFDDLDYLNALGLGRSPCTAGEAWNRLLDRFPPSDSAGEWTEALETILRRGPLARRMLAAVDGGALESRDRSRGRGELRALFTDLAACLEENRPFVPSEPLA